jgi:hypothetical protein
MLPILALCTVQVHRGNSGIMFRIIEVSVCVGEIVNGAATLADKVQLLYVTLTERPPVLTMQCMTENVHISVTQET